LEDFKNIIITTLMLAPSSFIDGILPTYTELLLTVFPACITDIIWHYDGEIYKLIGVREFKEVQSAEAQSEGAVTEEMTQYSVFLSRGIFDRKYFVLTGRNQLGMCTSGWTTATWGELDTFHQLDLNKQPIGTLHYTPRTAEAQYVRWNTTDESGEETSAMPQNNYFNRVLELAFHVDPAQYELNWVVRATLVGDDEYYPRGYCEINAPLLLQPTIRLQQKRPVYLFQGPSGIGKSFLGGAIAQHSEVQVYETDSNETLPLNLSDYHVIVVGNKYKTHSKSVLGVLQTTQLAEDKPPIELVFVNFAYAAAAAQQTK
jgi:hypothetical protein